MVILKSLLFEKKSNTVNSVANFVTPEKVTNSNLLEGKRNLITGIAINMKNSVTVLYRLL